MAKKSFPNSGILSRNTRKTSDKHPEYSGSAEIDGVEYWISAWVKDGQNGKFFSMSFKPKEQQSGGGGGQQRSQGQQRQQSDRHPPTERYSDMDDDAPPF